MYLNRNIYLILFLFLMGCKDKNVIVSVTQPVIPVLTLKETNPVLKIELKRDRPIDYSIKQIDLSLSGTTNIGDIQSVQLFQSDENGEFSTKNQIGETLSAASRITFKGNFPVKADTLGFWVSVKLKNKIDLTHRIHISCQNILTDRGVVDLPSDQPSNDLRVGVALRQNDQDHINTSRIPGLATSNEGTLLAICDARRESSRDLQGNIDVILHRSIDGGQSWQPLQVILDRGKWGGLPEKFNGISDACILVDEQTGAIFVAGLWMYGVLDDNGQWINGLTEESTAWKHQWMEKGSQPGFGVKQTSQFLITKSTDDGLTWNDPVNITPTNKKKEWQLYAPAPGHGITLSDGTLVFPTDGLDENGVPFSNITWSKDHGETWITSNPAYKNTSECMAVQLSDGSIMLNMRAGRQGRIVCTTRDLGETWVEHPTSEKTLIEPGCMASLHKHICHQDGETKSILLFSNPNSRTDRDYITIKVSYDNGNTWPKDKWILLDEHSGMGYSCLTSVNDSVIGIFYECSQADIAFQEIPIKEFLK